jgi:hypothetical protein
MTAFFSDTCIQKQIWNVVCQKREKLLHFKSSFILHHKSTLRAVDQKDLENFEMWCWRRMEKISWTDHVRNEEVESRSRGISYMK